MEIAFPNDTGTTGQTPATVVAEIRRLHDTLGLSYRKIMLLEPFTKGNSTIPNSSICAMYHGHVHRKWYKQLNVVAPVEIIPCLSCGVVHLGRCPKKKSSSRRRTPGGWVNAKDPKRAAKQIAGRAEYPLEELYFALIEAYWNRNFGRKDTSS